MSEEVDFFAWGSGDASGGEPVGCEVLEGSVVEGSAVGSYEDVVVWVGAAESLILALDEVAVCRV